MTSAKDASTNCIPAASESKLREAAHKASIQLNPARQSTYLILPVIPTAAAVSPTTIACLSPLLVFPAIQSESTANKGVINKSARVRYPVILRANVSRAQREWRRTNR